MVWLHLIEFVSKILEGWVFKPISSGRACHWIYFVWHGKMQEKVFFKTKFNFFGYYKATNIDMNQIFLFSYSRIGERVMRKLADIASFAVKKTGIFHNSQTRPVDGSNASKGRKIIWITLL